MPILIYFDHNFKHPNSNWFSGPEVCHDKNIYSTMMKPEETCDLQPTTDCQIVTSLIPHLRQREVCESVPKEFCHTKLDSPKTVRKPVTMKWCAFLDGSVHHSSNSPSQELPTGHVPPNSNQPQSSPLQPSNQPQPKTPPVVTPPSYQNIYPDILGLKPNVIDKIAESTNGLPLHWLYL